MRSVGHVARNGGKKNAYRILVGRPEGKRPLGRPRRRWVDNIKMDLREMGCDGVEWIDMAQDRDQWRANGKTTTLVLFLDSLFTEVWKRLWTCRKTDYYLK
jgi:transposase